MQGNEQETTTGVDPLWEDVVKRIRIAVDAGEGITLNADEVRALNKALKAVASYILRDLKTRYGPVIARLVGATHE